MVFFYGSNIGQTILKFTSKFLKWGLFNNPLKIFSGLKWRAKAESPAVMFGFFC
jgi:hypothetical protein